MKGKDSRRFFAKTLLAPIAAGILVWGVGGAAAMAQEKMDTPPMGYQGLSGPLPSYPPDYSHVMDSRGWIHVDPQTGWIHFAPVKPVPEQPAQGVTMCGVSMGPSPESSPSPSPVAIAPYLGDDERSHSSGG